MAGLGQPFLVLSLATLFTCVLSQQQYFIAPHSSLCQTNASCSTLDQLAQTDRLTDGTNLTLIFQPGEHTLTRLLSIRNFRHVEIIGQNTSVISLHEESWIELSDIDQLSIERLAFTGHTTNDLMLPKQRLSIRNTRNLFVNSCSFTGLDTLKTTDGNGDVLTLRNTVNAVSESVLFEGNNGTALSIRDAGTVVIENSTFIGNRGFDGGAVYIDTVYTTVTINNSIFTSNSADNIGGAIFIGSGEVSISHSVLTGNIAERNGGGIAAFSGFTLTGNDAEQHGGGIVVVGLGSVSISYSVLTGNNADYGGGISVYSGNTSISHSSLTGNRAREIGGGICVTESGSAFISHSNLTGNIAAGHESEGGGIYVSGDAHISYSVLTGNSAELGGGGIAAYSGLTFIENVLFEGNIGTALSIIDEDSVSIENSTFTGNRGFDGGAVYIDTVNTTVTINNSIFTSNRADNNGGAIFIGSGEVSISHSVLTVNVAEQNGGGIAAFSDLTSVSDCNLTGNYARWYGGGIVVVDSGNASVSHTVLTGNNADYGGGISVYSGNTSISHSSLTGNRARDIGGGICVIFSGSAFISHSNLTGNIAESQGGGIYVSGDAYISYSVLTGNSADTRGGGLYVVSGSASISHSNLTGNSAERDGGAINIQSGEVSVSECNLTGNSNGSIYALNSQVHFDGRTVVHNNHRESGGAIEAVQSQIYFNSAVTISNNTAATTGGGIFLRESSLFVKSPAKIFYNTANEGGAIYAYQSTIEFNNAGDGNMISSNNAYINGGGIFAIASVVKVTKSFVNVESNTAEKNGGGFYLQQNSRLYIQKLINLKSYLEVKLNVSNNTARLGGGIYVDDSISASVGACRSKAINEAGSTDFLKECFIQTIRLSSVALSCHPCKYVSTLISNNTAAQSGSAIYGGLLDRCTVSQTAELQSASNGLDYIRKTVDLPADNHSISSDPLQVKLCDGSHSNVTTKKGQSFAVLLKAIDQVGNPVNATIHSSVVTQSGVGRLKEGQAEQRVDSECTELEYNVFSEDSSAQVELYAEGPCSNLGISNLTFNVMFLECTCPLGFHTSPQSSIQCSCECDQKLQAAECFPEEGTFLLDNMLWIGAAYFTDCNETGYLVHNCPFDYCVDKPVNISLNSSEEIDLQCAHNRSGVLCGECDEGLSLVLASSKCKQCSNIFLLLLIPFAVAGIALVVFILWLNITIATGTIPGLILYANVLAANKATFLPFPSPNFLTVFVSWVNLDLGIETCFYNGMNSQVKVLLQLVFPAYLFLLIFLIIILSKYVDSFAKLLSNRNPVAALCTLLILSYSKLLRLIIAALRFTFLACRDGANKIVWLYDANVQYFSPSHIPRFVVAAIILTACVLFTTLLFFGQWFPRCSKWKVMKWTKNTKYIGFMDAFHAPFTPKHRYWVGLLLFALIVHNLIASMAPDTSVPVLSAGCVAVGLIVYKSIMNRVYRSRFNNVLENIFLLNVAILALGTLTVMILNNNDGQLALAYVSMAVAFILFVVITCYHFYKFVLKKTNVWNNHVRPLNPAQRIDFNLRRNRNYQKLDERDDHDDVELPPVVDMYSNGRGPREETDPDKYITPPIIRLATRADQLREPDLDILAPITDADYRQGPPIPKAENRPRPVCTTTVVEIDKSSGP